MAADKQRNAAFTSQYDGEVQLFTVYRQQWQSIGVPYTTSAFFGTKRFYTENPGLQFYGGLFFINDESGDAKLTSNEATLNIGSSLQYGDNYFSFFVSPSFTFKTYNQNGLTFPSQYDRDIGGFNEDLSSGEAFQGESTTYFDLSIKNYVFYAITVKYENEDELHMKLYKSAMVKKDSQLSTKNTNITNIFTLVDYRRKKLVVKLEEFYLFEYLDFDILIN